MPHKHRKKIAIALQGGGSHGAFTWGILEKLLEEDVLDVRGMCGTSAGAMNAAITVYGMHKNGNKGAIDLLEQFWKRVSDASKYSIMQPSWLDNALYPGGMDFSPGYQFFNMFTNILSPYQFNPSDVNPLRDILLDLIDFSESNRSHTKLFVCATNVKTCKPKVFKSPDITVDSLMASACLPYLFKAVEIDGEAYWDGGYMGNPPIWPLIDGTDTNDILLLKVNPIEIENVPKTVRDIQDRINDISFNSSLINEMRMIYFKDKILDMGHNLKGKLRKINFHEIAADNVLHNYTMSSKSNTTWDFLNVLRMKGRECATQWLAEDFENVNLKSSLKIKNMYL
ncbi:MAG: patatin-like phospholipase family protein [Bacteroidia bacterium]